MVLGCFWFHFIVPKMSVGSFDSFKTVVGSLHGAEMVVGSLYISKRG